MGSYAESCAVSNLGIEVGDEVLWVYFKEKVYNVHDMADIIYRYDQSLQEKAAMKAKNDEFKARFNNALLQFPDVSEELFDLKIYDRPKEFEWGFGEYDDYGWVEGQELPDKYWGYHFLVRKSVADKMSEFGKSLIDREWEGRNAYLKDNYLYCFLLVCHLTRISLLGHSNTGRQGIDLQEMRERKFVHKIIGEEIKLVDREQKELERENKEWEKSFQKGEK